MLEDALLAAGWRPIATYPREYLAQEDVYWGPDVIVLVPPTEAFPHHPTPYVAHLEADMWLARDATDPTFWSDLHASPTHWMPLLPFRPQDLAAGLPAAT